MAGLWCGSVWSHIGCATKASRCSKVCMEWCQLRVLFGPQVVPGGCSVRVSPWVCLWASLWCHPLVCVCVLQLLLQSRCSSLASSSWLGSELEVYGQRYGCATKAARCSKLCMVWRPIRVLVGPHVVPAGCSVRVLPWLCLSASLWCHPWCVCVCVLHSRSAPLASSSWLASVVEVYGHR